MIAVVCWDVFHRLREKVDAIFDMVLVIAVG